MSTGFRKCLKVSVFEYLPVIRYAFARMPSSIQSPTGYVLATSGDVEFSLQPYEERMVTVKHATGITMGNGP